MSNSINDSAIKKLKLLITVVDRPKGEFYLDVLAQFPVNSQMALGGLGTAHSELVELLGLGTHGGDSKGSMKQNLQGTALAQHRQLYHRSAWSPGWCLKVVSGGTRGTVGDSSSIS